MCKKMCIYLYEVCLSTIVHYNFKSINILLDNEINPHISDYGIVSFTLTSGHLWPLDIVKSPGFFKLRGTHTKAQSSYFFFFYFYFLWQKSVEKSPMKTYMVKRAFWKFSKKKTKSPHVEEGKTKSFEIATFWGEKK